MGSGKRAPGEPGLAAEAGWFALVMASVVHGSVAPLLAGVPVGPALAAAAAVAALLYAAFRHGTGALFCSAVFCNELGRWAADGAPLAGNTLRAIGLAAILAGGVHLVRSHAGVSESEAPPRNGEAPRA